MVQQNNNYQCFFHRRFRLVRIIVLCCIVFLSNPVTTFAETHVDSLVLSTTVPKAGSSLFVVEGTKITNLEKISYKTKVLIKPKISNKENLTSKNREKKKNSPHLRSSIKKKEIQTEKEKQSIKIYPIHGKDSLYGNIWEIISAVTVSPNNQNKLPILFVKKITISPIYFAQIPENKKTGTTQGIPHHQYLHTAYGGVRPPPFRYFF